MYGRPGNVVFLLWQAFGNLNNGANSGIACANLNNALSNANWNIGARESGKFPRIMPYIPRCKPKIELIRRPKGNGGIKDLRCG